MVALIRRSTYAEILEARDLLDEYAAECSIHEIGPINPQAEMYRAMEQMGLAHMFGAFHVESLNEPLHEMQSIRAAEGAEILSHVPCREDARIPRSHANESRTAEQAQCAELCESVSAAGKASTPAVQGLRSANKSNAPHGLQQAASGGMGLPQTSSGNTSGRLVGFASLLVSVLPHYGKKAATVESLFVDKRHRANGYGIEIMDAMEEFAKGEGCIVILYIAPVGSQLERLLSLKKGYRKTNSVFCRVL